MATRRQCVFMPPPWLLEEPRALGKVLFLDCQLEWNVPEETPKACIPFLLPSLPLSPGHNPIPATPLCGGCFHHRWGDPKEGSWRWEPYHLETWSPWVLSELFQPRGSTSSGRSRCSFSAGGPARIWRSWAGAEGNRLTRSMGQGSSHWLARPPQLPQPQDSPSKGPRPAQTSGMWQQPRSLRPEGSTVSILFL